MEAVGQNSAVFEVSFMPEHSADHLITVTFNEQNVPGKLTHTFPEIEANSDYYDRKARCMSNFGVILPL